MPIQLEIDEWAEVCNRLQRAEHQRDKLREALEWIADNYPRDDASVINQTARAALAAIEESAQ